MQDQFGEARNIIFNKNHLAQKSRSRFGNSFEKFFVSQLIGTPDFGYGGATIFGVKDGPRQLQHEQTPEGYFNLTINEWVTHWIDIEHLHVNVVITDYIESTRLIPTLIRANLGG